MKGGDTSIVLDSSGRAHISYFDVTNEAIKYATNASGSWVTTTVDSTLGKYGGYASIALDTSGKAHISYRDWGNKDLKYATNASGSWVTSIVDSDGDVGAYTSIVLDSSDKAHISYYDSTNKDLKYATNASGSWVTNTVDSSGSVSGYTYTSIALDNTGKAHISYRDWDNEDLKYATNASGAWVNSFVNSGGVEYTSIAVDSSDNVHISYSSSGGVKYTTNAFGSWWMVSAVDSSESAGAYTSIAIDNSGKTHISYYDSANKCLRYATNAEVTTDTPTPVTSPTPGGCSASAITASPFSLVINKSKTYKDAITVWVLGDGGCAVQSAKVKAKLDKAGRKVLTVKPSSRKTDPLGVATFSIKTKKKAGNATITFSTQGAGFSITTIASVVVTE